MGKRKKGFKSRFSDNYPEKPISPPLKLSGTTSDVAEGVLRYGKGESLHMPKEVFSIGTSEQKEVAKWFSDPAKKKY